MEILISQDTIVRWREQLAEIIKSCEGGLKFVGAARNSKKYIKDNQGYAAEYEDLSSLDKSLPDSKATLFLILYSLDSLLAMLSGTKTLESGYPIEKNQDEIKITIEPIAIITTLDVLKLVWGYTAGESPDNLTALCADIISELAVTV